MDFNLVLLTFNMIWRANLDGMITVEDVDLADPSAGHEEALSLPKLGDAEPLDVLHRRREPVQMRSKRLALGA